MSSSASFPFPPPPYGQQVCPGPPYNATNFTPANAVEYSTILTYAQSSPNYPWNTGTDAQQIFRSNQNITYFNNINLQTSSIKAQNGATGKTPYPQFKSETERLMYKQGQALVAARLKVTGQNPIPPAGVPCSTIYQYINTP